MVRWGDPGRPCVSAKKDQRPRARPRKKPAVVLTFGENMNDSRAIAELIVAANPSLAGRVQPKPKPISLTKDAGEQAQRQWVAEIRKVVDAFTAAQGPVAAIVVHRDADGFDPSGQVEANLAATLATLGNAHPAVPVQMTEAWWFLFPDAVESIRPQTWRGVIPSSGSDVERIEDPKKRLKALTRARGAEYAESDSVEIAASIRKMGLAPQGVCASYSRFLAMASTLPS